MEQLIQSETRQSVTRTGEFHSLSAGEVKVRYMGG